MRNEKGQFLKIKPELRFWNKVKKSKGCWVWTGKIRSTDGYGVLAINRKEVRSHRLSWEMKNGSIPFGKVVCHSCDNPKCVNPSHLFLGTQADNMRDMRNKGRNEYALKGSRHPKSKFSETDVNVIRGLYLTSKITQQEIAKRFNTSQQSINRIVLRKRYA